MISFDGVIHTYNTLMQHFLERSKNNHLFLSCISEPRTNIWFKGDVNCREGTIRKWMSTMAKNDGLTRGITNKSSRVTLVTRMLAARVPNDVIAKITGHRNLKT